VGGKMSSTVGGFLIGFGLCLFLMSFCLTLILGYTHDKLYDVYMHWGTLWRDEVPRILTFLKTIQGVLNWGGLLGTILVIIGVVLVVMARVRRRGSECTST